MDSYSIDKWEDLQNVDMAVREVQLYLDKIKQYEDCTHITNYNNKLEELRSTIHEKMKEVQSYT